MFVLAGIALATPSFLSAPSLTTLLTTISFVGCLAAAMTFITISGNIMSFALGAAAAVSAMVFVVVLNAAGYATAVIAALAAGAAVTAAQGCLVGFLRTNPIIVSIAANVLIYGVAQRVTNNETVQIGDAFLHSLLKGKVFEAPVEFIVFLAVIALGQAVLSLTVFGRNLFYVGSGLRAAETIGLPTVRTTIGAYLWAGLFAAVTGILLASRFHQANMEFALRYDYDAIAAVLVGGTAIQGGNGSMLRTLVGVAAVSTIQVVLLLYGFREEWRLFITGLIVVAVVILYSSRQRQ
ncbi:MAG TPA: ABC transporter permease [Candidatus Binataceae bacterium]|nr:ABC transporter permease [Candidatus Binataceae bacterium]